MSDAETLRSLDQGERYAWLADVVSSMNFVVLAELAGHPLSEAPLRDALGALQAHHPLLAATVHEAANGAVAFHRAAGVAIPLTVERCDAEDWQGPVGAEFLAPFHDGGGATMRCRLLQLPGRSLLALTFYHAVADARSGVMVLKQLLRLALRGDAIGDPMPVPPPMHALFPPAFRWTEQPGKAEALAQEIAAEAAQAGAPAELPFLAHREPRRAPRIRQIRLDGAAGRALQARCRAEGTTVHGAICAAQLIATQALFAEAEPRTLYLVCPADLRPHVAPGLEGQLSFCTTLLRATYRVAGADSIWDLARAVGEDLRRRLRRGDGHLVYAALPLDRLGRAEQARPILAQALDQLPAGSNISNIGRVEPLDDCPEVEAISFALLGMPKHLASLNASSYRDAIIINLTSDAAKLPSTLADRMAEHVERLLADAAT